jgi:thymidylate kinase
MKVNIPDEARIIIIEGVAGSGKDTLQQLLKKQFKNKIVYDYAEGDLLFTWKLARVEGIAKLRLKLLNYFTDFMDDTIKQEPQSFFLLNRFHLSNYMAHVSRDKSLEPQYKQVVNKLKKLPIHILLLQLSAEEIDRRSSHMERPMSWKKYQKLMVKKEGFVNKVERYLHEQKVMLEEAKKNGLPYSIVHLNL